ncbi:MAG: hypothetical protein KDK70_28560, partial [Myxococcales bacterium]|nr:hypothetical protein [Myxococcales bacterium]
MLGALLLVACAGGKAYKPAPPQPYPAHPTPIAGDPQHAELPAHHFYARAPQARPWPRPQPVAFRALPAMVQSRKCVDAGSIPEGRPLEVQHGKVETKTAKPKAKKTKDAKQAPGHVP